MVDNIEFKIFSKLVHTYKVPGLNDRLIKYKDELVKEGENYQNDKNESLNFLLKNNILSENLFNTFSQIAHKYYNIDNTYDPRKIINVYYQTKKQTNNFFHHHCEASIVGTTYIDPHLIEEGGELEFLEKFVNVDTPIQYKIKPEKDYIYMFPGWLLHQPLPHASNFPRICFNWVHIGSKRPVNKISGDIW